MFLILISIHEKQIRILEHHVFCLDTQVEILLLGINMRLIRSNTSLSLYNLSLFNLLEIQQNPILNSFQQHRFQIIMKHIQRNSFIQSIRISLKVSRNRIQHLLWNQYNQQVLSSHRLKITLKIFIKTFTKCIYDLDNLT